MGYYEYLFNKNGEILTDPDGNYILKTDENENPIVNPDGDYFVIYNADFEDELLNMFEKFAYKDLTHSYVELSNGEKKSNLTMLNEKWETLKIESTSMVGIYVICLLIALGVVAYFVYTIVKKRRQRRFYWANVATPKQPPKKQEAPDFSETAVIAIEKSKKRDK